MTSVHTVNEGLIRDLNLSHQALELKLRNKQIHALVNIILFTQCPRSSFLSEGFFLPKLKQGNLSLRVPGLCKSWGHEDP